MDGYIPIIYVRGYAGTQSAVERTVDLPYYGFNLGSTQVRTDAQGDPQFFIFESPLIRLMKDHGYEDFFVRVDEQGRVEELKHTDDYPLRSLWIYRYYDQTSERAGEGDRDDIEGLADDLNALVDHVRRRTGAPKVHLVAHSMGGLICRSLIQRTLKSEAPRKIDRLFTYGTPHGGIHFRRGMGFLTAVRDLLGFNDSDTFGPGRMREYLGFAEDHAVDRLHEIGPHFPVARVFSMVGTNHTDYGLARLAVGPGSDGLVKINHAYVKGSSRAFVYRAHSGPLGIVNSEEGYQNLHRFLFGDISVEILLDKVVLKDRYRDDDSLRFILIEPRVAIRGQTILMTDQKEAEGSAVKTTPAELAAGQETLFRTYLSRVYRPSAADRYSFFQVRIRLIPHYVSERRVLRDRHFVGEYLFQDTLTIGVRDPDNKPGRLIRAAWAAMEADVPRSGRRYSDEGDIRFALTDSARSGAVAGGDLVFRIRREQRQ